MDSQRLEDLVPRDVWTPERHARVGRRLLHEGGRAPGNRLRALAFVSAGLGAALVGSFALWPRVPSVEKERSEPATASLRAARDPRPAEGTRHLVLADNSVVTLFDDDSNFQLEKSGPGVVTGRLLGRA